MDVFCTEAQSQVLARRPDAAERVLPLPGVLDPHVVVLLHLLLREQPQRPVTLDASGLRRVDPVAALLLATTLRAREQAGAPARIAKLGFALRRRLEHHPLMRFVSVEPPRLPEPVVGTLAGAL